METIELDPQQAEFVREVLTESKGLTHGSLLIIFRDGRAQKIDRTISRLLGREAKARPAKAEPLAA